MNSPARLTLSLSDCKGWLCPDLRPYWKISRSQDSPGVILEAIASGHNFLFSAMEGYALQYFIGLFTVAEVHYFCEQRYKQALPTDFIAQLIEKLITAGILAPPEGVVMAAPPPPPKSMLKPCLQWIQHPGGYWILRNPENVTFMQVSTRHQPAIAELGQLPLPALAQKHNLTPNELQYLMQLLTATGMLTGTQPPAPPKRKFTPLQLLFFKVRLFNPDAWLNLHIDKLRWIWTNSFAWLISCFLAWSAIFGMSHSGDIYLTGKQLWAMQGSSLILSFALLTMLVVSLHELGHAFTLKNYGGIVPEIGLMFMCLVPGCYTNTTDAYCLVKRRQRVLVVAAGVLVQLIIWAIALWLWKFSNPSTWLHTASYLLMVAALFTVAVNLNPLSRLDGYYLAVALTGINNLRSRSFLFYANLLRGRIIENKSDRLILALYAPFSLIYTLLLFGHLLLWMGEWIFINIPVTAVIVLIFWLIYLLFPTKTR